MQPETPTVPHVWLLLSNALTAFLTVLTTLTAVWFRRKREPVEIAKLHAETRQIQVNTDVSLIQAATVAIAKAERLQDERDHWERKATDLMLDLEDARNSNSEKEIRLRLHEYQTKRLKGLLDIHSISYSEIDRVRMSDAHSSDPPNKLNPASER